MYYVCVYLPCERNHYPLLNYNRTPQKHAKSCFLLCFWTNHNVGFNEVFEKNFWNSSKQTTWLLIFFFISSDCRRLSLKCHKVHDYIYERVDSVFSVILREAKLDRLLLGFTGYGHASIGGGVGLSLLVHVGHCLVQISCAINFEWDFYFPCQIMVNK